MTVHSSRNEILEDQDSCFKLHEFQGMALAQSGQELTTFIYLLPVSCKRGFTRRAKAGDNNQQAADDTKTAIPRPFTRTGKKVIIFPSFDAGASGQLKTCQCQCKIVLIFFIKQ